MQGWILYLQIFILLYLLLILHPMDIFIAQLIEEVGRTDFMDKRFMPIIKSR